MPDWLVRRTRQICYDDLFEVTPIYRTEQPSSSPGFPFRAAKATQQLNYET